MSLNDGLLEQAKHLLGRDPRRPRQVNLRRAISNAYYSLFHLLTYEASRTFVKDPETIAMIARSYDHVKMYKISRLFSKGDLPKKLHPLQASLINPTRIPTVNRLKAVAQAFMDLQDARHLADYDLGRQYTRADARNFVELAETTFANWKLIRKDDLARIYLACFLVFEDWNKDR